MRLRHKAGIVAGVAAASALAGAAAAALTTPRTGRQTRAGIRRRLSQARTESRKRLKDVKDVVSKD